MRWKSAVHTAADKSSTAGWWWRRGATTRQLRRDGVLRPRRNWKPFLTMVDLTACQQRSETSELYSRSCYSTVLSYFLTKILVDEDVRGNAYSSPALLKYTFGR